MNKVEYLEIENIGKTRIPVLYVVIKDCDTKEIVKKGWLSPFRAYSFQVSGSPDGVGDCGASKVIGLKHCIYFSSNDSGIGFQSNYDAKGIGKQLLLGQALIALLKWADHSDMGEWDHRWYNEENQLSKFIDECYDWLRSI